MRTIETTVVITPDGKLTVQVPSDILPGEHRIIVVIDERISQSPTNPSEIDAALAEMANDPDYQAEALRIEAELATAQWEALQMVELEE